MTDQKHFSYEGNVTLKNKAPERIEITDVEFLTPARVKANVDGSERTYVVSVDIINRKVYDDKGQLFMSDEVFAHLDNAHSVPEDFFAAPEEVHQKAWEANAERERINEEMIGVQDE